MSNFFTNLANQVLKYANDNPRDFLFLVLVILTPFFLLSAFLSWKLSKHLEQDKKKKSKPKPKADTKKAHSKGGRVKRE